MTLSGVVGNYLLWERQHGNIMDTPYHYGEGGGGVGCLNKWFFIKKSMFKYGGIIFEIMERYCNIVIHSACVVVRCV